MTAEVLILLLTLEHCGLSAPMNITNSEHENISSTVGTITVLNKATVFNPG